MNIYYDQKKDGDRYRTSVHIALEEGDAAHYLSSEDRAGTRTVAMTLDSGGMPLPGEPQIFLRGTTEQLRLLADQIMDHIGLKEKRVA